MRKFPAFYGQSPSSLQILVPANVTLPFERLFVSHSPFPIVKGRWTSSPCILLDIILHADLFGCTVTNLSWTSTILFFQDTQKVHCDCFCFLLIGRSCSSIRPCSMSTGSVPRHVCHVVLELRQFRQQFTVGELLTDANFRSAN